MEIFKSIKTEASKEFEKLLDTQFSKTQSLVEGKIIEGVVTKITEKFVFLDCGLKSEPIIDINELKTIGLEKEIIIGGKIPVLLERLEDRNGEIVVSASKAQKIKGWDILIDKFEKFLDNSAKQVGGYKILVVLALFLGYFLGSIFS